MRKSVLALVAAGSALAVATPAAAQYYPQSRDYGYNGYGRSYGYDRGYGDASGLHRRIVNVLNSIDGVRSSQRERLRYEAINLDRQLRYASRNGLNPYEAQNFNVRIGQLERRLQYASYGRYRGNGYNGYNGYNGSNRDRDRDGRDDRWEDDRGYDHDD